MAEPTVTLRQLPTAPVRAPGPRLTVVWSPAGSLAPGTTFELMRGVTLVGRAPDAPGDIALGADAHVSRVHAAVEVEGDSVTVEDRGSHNGTFVNGVAVAARERWALGEGSVLRVGATLFVLRRDRAGEDAAIPELVGDAPATRRLRAAIARVAPENGAVLLLGETGTGKEVAASAIHRLSGRTGPHVAVNMSAVPAELAESVFFGHLTGAFTGGKASVGYFRAAHEGTLLLDEIGDAPLALQPKLLRVLEEQRVTPIGATQPIQIDARVLAATNRDLESAARAGDFRRDLYARLADLQIRLMPLRDRREDIPLLLAFACGGRLPDLSTEVAELLLCYRWPRNVRELLTVARHLRVFGVDDTLLARLRAPEGDDEVEETESAKPRQERLVVPTRAQLEAIMERSGGVIAQVAAELGCSRRHVGRWLEELGIDRERFRHRR